MTKEELNLYFKIQHQVNEESVNILKRRLELETEIFGVKNPVYYKIYLVDINSDQMYFKAILDQDYQDHEEFDSYSIRTSYLYNSNWEEEYRHRLLDTKKRNEEIDAKDEKLKLEAERKNKELEREKELLLLVDLKAKYES